MVFEYGMDFWDVVVGVVSVLVKVERDVFIVALEGCLGIRIGSGYLFDFLIR